MKLSAGWGGKKRLRARREFNEVYEHGKTFTDGLLVLKYLANDKGYSRAGFSVGKRLAKAASRNRAKRLMREALRSLYVREGWDLIFISRPALIKSSFHQVRESIEKVLGRAGLLLSENK